MDDDDDDPPDPDATERLQLLEDELLRLAKGFHDIFAGDPELELSSAALSQAKFSNRQSTTWPKRFTADTAVGCRQPLLCS